MSVFRIQDSNVYAWSTELQSAESRLKSRAFASHGRLGLRHLARPGWVRISRRPRGIPVQRVQPRARADARVKAQ